MNIKIVTWKRLKKILTKEKYEEFSKWMTGQTCLDLGVYEHDFLRWVQEQEIID